MSGKEAAVASTGTENYLTTADIYGHPGDATQMQPTGRFRFQSAIL